MSRWNGPASKGAMRRVREQKREEAELRQAEEKERYAYIEAYNNVEPNLTPDKIEQNMRAIDLLVDIFSIIESRGDDIVNL